MSLVGLFQCPARHLSMCPSGGVETLCQGAIIVSDECSGIMLCIMENPRNLSLKPKFQRLTRACWL